MTPTIIQKKNLDWNFTASHCWFAASLRKITKLIALKKHAKFLEIVNQGLLHCSIGQVFNGDQSGLKLAMHTGHENVECIGWIGQADGQEPKGRLTTKAHFQVGTSLCHTSHILVKCWHTMAMRMWSALGAPTHISRRTGAKKDVQSFS